MNITFNVLEDKLEHLMALLATANSPLERHLPSAMEILTKGTHSILVHLHHVVYFSDGTSVAYWVDPLLATEFRTLIHQAKGSTPGDRSGPDNLLAAEWLLREYHKSLKYKVATTWLTWAPTVLKHIKQLEAGHAQECSSPMAR